MATRHADWGMEGQLTVKDWRGCQKCRGCHEWIDASEADKKCSAKMRNGRRCYCDNGLACMFCWANQSVKKRK